MLGPIIVFKDANGYLLQSNLQLLVAKVHGKSLSQALRELAIMLEKADIYQK